MYLVFYGFIIFLVLLIVIWFFNSGVLNNFITNYTSWASPYECGFSPMSLSFNFFSFTYFSLLVFFVVFDLEISLLLNMPDQGVLFSNFYYYMFFLLVLSLSFIGEVLMGYVRWGY
uniref:NADH-ubiquinone oxidoreductase chain 3 n=1 Tax=Tetrabothrius erostris TaxID=70678 RepID=R4I2A7_9CEST|nr:NADH dehydrogenase subunit 3 [Tetrabothrius erostris]